MPMPTEEELLQYYGPEVHRFTHTIKDPTGQVISREELIIREKLKRNWIGSSIFHLSLLDREGRRVALNRHSQEGDRVYSGFTATNYDSGFRKKVGRHNTCIENPYRIVPGAAAALIAQYAHSQRKTWYSSQLRYLSGRRTTDSHTAKHLYGETLNTHYGNLVTSRLVGQSYVVEPVL